MAALVVVLGLAGGVPVPLIAVPVTLQTLGVMLAADLVGGPIAAGAMALFVAGVAAGLPLLSGGRGGLNMLQGPTGGYIIGWILGSLVIGWIARAIRRGPDLLRLLVANVIGGILVIHACGVVWLVVKLGVLPAKALLGDAVFLPGDLLKAVLAALIAVAVFRGYPAARRAGRE
jgi:biotin transport system substrate-specific component